MYPSWGMFVVSYKLLMLSLSIGTCSPIHKLWNQFDWVVLHKTHEQWIINLHLVACKTFLNLFVQALVWNHNLPCFLNQTLSLEHVADSWPSSHIFWILYKFGNNEDHTHREHLMYAREAFFFSTLQQAHFPPSTNVSYVTSQEYPT